MTTIKASHPENGIVDPRPEEESMNRIHGFEPTTENMPILIDPDTEASDRQTGGGGAGSDTNTTTDRADAAGDGGSAEAEGGGVAELFGNALEDARSVLDGELPETPAGWLVLAAPVVAIILAVRAA